MESIKLMDEISNKLQLALQFNLPIFMKLPEKLLPKDIYKQLPYQFVKEHLALPLTFSASNQIIVALADPLKAHVLEDLRLEFPYTFKPAFAPKEVIMEGIEKCYHQENEATKELIQDLKENSLKSDEEEIDFNDLLDDRESLGIVKLLNAILQEAIQLKASDIHFEPFENDFQVRYRVDGILQKRHTPPKDTVGPLISRLKVLAKLDIAEHRLPQDGRIKLMLAGRSIDLRISTIPVAHGERVVLRVLDKANIELNLEKIGMPPTILERFKEFINAPEGIILVTGPTGSGKTTTLYSAISEIYDEEINIMTIEDPIEYKLPGIAQIGVQPKINLTFSSGLRHILRQDPDVILLGEIRDKETAQIAVQASLTGHLVLSTLHTNDAPSAVLRLIDMGIEPYLLSSSLIAVIAQRLIRVLCPECKYSLAASPKEIEELNMQDIKVLFKSKGCANCLYTGFKGRRALYEIMPMSPSLKMAILKDPQLNDVRSLTSFYSLSDHGKMLVKEGVTSLQEMLRVIKYQS